ncbi:MAG: ABC transporter substrate-binding protein [Aggregatilineales bacterium]
MSKSTFSLVLLLFALVLSACSSNDATQEAEVATELIPVSIQLSWTHEYSSSPFYSAAQNGHFTEQGLDVTLIEGGFGEAGYIDPIEQVVSGNADFSLAAGSSLLLERASGQPVVAISSILQRSPLAIISIEGSDIRRPADLAGHTISAASGGAQTTLISLLESQDLSEDDINFVERTSFGVDPLVNGEVDGLVAWIINEGVTLQEQGLVPEFIMMSDYGVDTYDFVLITSETMINDRPDVVQRVINAMREGLQDVVDNPAQAIEHTLIYNPELVADEQLRRLEATIPLMNVPGQPLGAMDERVWQFTHDILIEQNILAEPIALDDAYNLTFIPTEAED